ncbi:MAG: hypothetical protein Tsb002_21830 [Wenzhouxiangellaceae bacterium]
MSKRYWSLAGRMLALCLVLVLASTLLTAGLTLLELPLWLTIAASLLLIVPLAILLVQAQYRPLHRRLQALIDGAQNLRENDFSTSIAVQKNDEIGDLIHAFNQVSDVLRNERRHIFQRELLLDTVLQSAPLALVLTDLQHRIMYANPHARHLFLAGHKLEGLNFFRILEDSPDALREAVLEGRQGLVTIDHEGEPEIYHIARQHFVLNARDHDLWLFKPMTQELNRQEVATWKKVIRVISHELNNSLGPIVSLSNSGLQLSQRPADQEERLQLIFSTIGERAQHLHRFIDGYARFARLPRPQLQAVEWRPFITQVREAVPFVIADPLPEQPAVFDPVQMEQVLINLLKNAHESGSAEAQVQLRIDQQADGLRLQVLDRGTGISQTVMANAVLPFYSTKKSGTGLGLALCREIIEAHDGRLAISNRPEGGACVSLWLPARPPERHSHESDAGKSLPD